MQNIDDRLRFAGVAPLIKVTLIENISYLTVASVRIDSKINKFDFVRNVRVFVFYTGYGVELHSPVELRDMVRRQYVVNPDGEGEVKWGDMDDPAVPPESVTPIYALAVLLIENKRWDDMPFILRCGKGC